MSLISLTSGPSYVANKSLKISNGAVTVANTCYTEPDVGYTVVLGMTTTEASLPSYMTYDSTNIAVTADPQDNSLIGSSFTVTFNCYLAEMPTSMNYEESVVFSVVQNPDPATTCPDPTDTTDPTCPTTPDTEESEDDTDDS